MIYLTNSDQHHEVNIPLELGAIQAAHDQAADMRRSEFRSELTAAYVGRVNPLRFVCSALTALMVLLFVVGGVAIFIGR